MDSILFLVFNTFSCLQFNIKSSCEGKENNPWIQAQCQPHDIIIDPFRNDDDDREEMERYHQRIDSTVGQDVSASGSVILYGSRNYSITKETLIKNHVNSDSTFIIVTSGSLNRLSARKEKNDSRYHTYIHLL